MRTAQPFLNVTTPMPPKLEQEARQAAARLDISRSELIRRAVIKFLEVSENG